MAQYKVSEITNIYWATNDGFKVGRDPMGIQNSSVATYGCLLPGMTNLTGHIRYYSLYCWLLNKYDELEKNNNVSLHQYNFIRRAELIIAFIMYSKDVQAVVGHNFVRDKSNKICHNGIYAIYEGADYENNGNDKYWAYISGAFGQYYLGSLIYYELVKIEEGRFYLRNKGRQLAKAVEESVNKNILNLFSHCILNGELSNNDIEKLQPLGLHSIIKLSTEWNMLNNLLTATDANGSTLRRETMYLMLSDFDNGVRLKDFVEHRFLSIKDTTKCHNASFGWYFYYLCEKLHYCIETIFCFILNEIDSLRNPPIDVLINRCVDDILLNINKAKLYNDINTWRQECTQPIVGLFKNITKAINEQDYAMAAYKSIELCLRLYNELKENETEIIDFEKHYDLYMQRGILRECLHDYVEKFLSVYPKEYVQFLVRQIMNEHTFVAISKMGNNNMDLRKFILEDGCAVLVEMRYPNQTNPRIESLHNFLVDLGYLSIEGMPTYIAYQYMKNYDEE